MPMWLISDSSTNLRHRLVTSLELQLRHSLVGRLTHGRALGHGALPPATTNTHAVHNIALLRLVAQPPGLVRTGRARGAVDGGQLPELPAANPQKKSEQIRLFLLVQLFQILVRPHPLTSPEREGSTAAIKSMYHRTESMYASLPPASSSKDQLDISSH